MKLISLTGLYVILSKVYQHFRNDPLYKNSLYLMLNNATLAFFGFFFWILCARLYSPDQIGISTTLISMMTLISTFSVLGLNVGLVRFLPKSEVKNEKINSSFTIAFLTSIVGSIIFLLGIHIFSPKLLFLRENILYIISFIMFVVSISVGQLTESIFLAYRSAKYILIKNVIMSVIKLGLPFFMVGLSAYGIFASFGIASVTAFLIAIGFLVYRFKYHYQFMVHWDIIKKIGTYSFLNYIANLIGSLPTMILPLIVINKLGAAEAAYFYIALMIANLIFMIPFATTQSLLAEGSHSEEKIKELTIKAIKIILLLLIPVIIIMVFFGEYILLAFGKEYSAEAFGLLKLFTVSSIFLAINNINGTILRIKNKMKTVISLGIIDTSIILSLSYFFIGTTLLNIGIIWLFSHAAVSVIYFAASRRYIWR